MSGYSVVLAAGVVLLVIGTVVLFFLPQRQGGTVKLFTLEVSAPGAGLVLIFGGLAAAAWAAPQVPQIGFVLSASASPTQTALPAPAATATTASTVLATQAPTLLQTQAPAAPETVAPAPAQVDVTCAPNAATGYLPLKNGPGTAFNQLGQINEGETVKVLAWSYTTDGSAVAPFWLYVRTSDGKEGWMQSRENATPVGSGYVYPTCKGIQAENQDPATYPIPLRTP
jgi:hypothetical protein